MPADSSSFETFAAAANPDYTVFGHMDEASTTLVAELAADGTESGLGDGAPATPVDITSAAIG